jgi:hypothetical protein
MSDIWQAAIAVRNQQKMGAAMADQRRRPGAIARIVGVGCGSTAIMM